MTSPSRPSGLEISGFLRMLRHYRGTLLALDQGLLDALVAAGLRQSPYEVLEASLQSLWYAYAARPSAGRFSDGSNAEVDLSSWWTTPWGLARRAALEASGEALDAFASRDSLLPLWGDDGQVGVAGDDVATMGRLQGS